MIVIRFAATCPGCSAHDMCDYCSCMVGQTRISVDTENLHGRLIHGAIEVLNLSNQPLSAGAPSTVESE